MKIQAVVVLAAVLILTTFVAESELFSPGKTELREKVWKPLLIKLYLLVSPKKAHSSKILFISMYTVTVNKTVDEIRTPWMDC